MGRKLERSRVAEKKGGTMNRPKGAIRGWVSQKGDREMEADMLGV